MSENSNVDHKHIYLQPECCADENVGRLWCQDPINECDEGVEWTKYVRVDPTATMSDAGGLKGIDFFNGLDPAWLGDNDPTNYNMTSGIARKLTATLNASVTISDAITISRECAERSAARARILKGTNGNFETANKLCAADVEELEAALEKA